MRKRKHAWTDELRVQLAEATEDIESVLSKLDGKPLRGIKITVELDPQEFAKVRYEVDSFPESYLRGEP